MTRLLTQFADLLRGDPGRALIHQPGVGCSYSVSDVWIAQLALAEALARVGVCADRLVVSAMGNGAASVPLLLACRALGAALMPVDAGATAVEIEALAHRFGAAATVTPSPAGGLDVRIASAADRPFPPARSFPGAAVLKLTSGSTGSPKAALTTEAQLVADATQIIATMGIRPDDTQIAAIPISHSYGLGNLMLPLLLQGTAIVLRDSFVPHQLPDDARRFAARVFPGVPFMFEYFLATPPPGGWPASLRLLISAGAPLAAATASGFRERHGVKIHSFYGTSETGGIAYDGGDEPNDADAIGQVIPGVVVTLRSADCGPPNLEANPETAMHSAVGHRPSATGDPQPASRGDMPQRAGLVHVASPAVALGYSDGDSDAFVDGGFLTGDCGRFDACGRLVLVGRVSPFVNVAGRKVHPAEVEEVLRSMPGVADVRVVAALDERRGQQLVACIVAQSPAVTLLEVRRFCASRLAPHKTPRSVVFLDRIPLTARGKTDRAALADLVRARIGLQAM